MNGGSAPGTRRAELLLLLAAAIWGFAFVAQKAGMSHVGPFTFNGIRFALGGLALLPWILRRRGRPGTGGAASGGRPLLPLLRPGIAAGLVLFLGASLQQIGIVYTTAGKAGFITGLYVIFVPILGALGGRMPGRAAWAGASLATAGLYLLGIEGRAGFARGDLLVLASALFFAVHVLLIGRLSGERRLPAIPLAAAQYGTVSAASLLAAAFVESATLGGVLGAAWPILYGGVLSVGVAYTLQVAGQRSAPPAHAAVILSLEAVFAAIGGFIVFGERIPARGLAGCALMLGGILVSQRGALSRAGRAAPEGKG
ncbi:MAG: DMT family transporter [Candidatus Eisenbacteria bacterium]